MLSSFCLLSTCSLILCLEFNIYMSKPKIFSDFSDTIAKPKKGNKFSPFEIELAKMVGLDISHEYEHFLSVRSDIRITPEEKMQIWLKPFEGVLTQKHIENLVSKFTYNENFIKTIEIIKDKMDAKTIDINIVSGTLWQIVEAFLYGDESSKISQKYGLKFKIGATKLGFNSDGKYSGKLVVTNKLAFLPASSFSDKCLVIGDNSMEDFGFGIRLINVQNFNHDLVCDRVEHFLKMVGQI